MKHSYYRVLYTNKMTFEYRMYLSTLETSAIRSWYLTRCRRYLGFLLSFLVRIAKQSLGLRDFDHEKRIKLHHLLSFDYGDEATRIQHLFAILAVNFIDTSHFEQITIGDLTMIFINIIFNECNCHSRDDSDNYARIFFYKWSYDNVSRN